MFVMKTQAMDKIKAMVDQLGKASEVEHIVNYCVLFHKNFNDYETLKGLLPYTLYLQVCCRLKRLSDD